MNSYTQYILIDSYFAKVPSITKIAVPQRKHLLRTTEMFVMTRKAICTGNRMAELAFLLSQIYASLTIIKKSINQYFWICNKLCIISKINSSVL